MAAKTKNPWLGVAAIVGGAVAGWGLNKLGRLVSGADSVDRIVKQAADDETAAKKSEKDPDSDTGPSRAIEPKGGKCPNNYKMIFGLCRPCANCK